MGLRASDLGRLVWFLMLACATALALLPAAARFAWGRNRSAWEGALGSCVAVLCERSGPAAIKLAQIMSSRADLLSPAMISGLSRLQDKVRAPGERSLRRILVRAYGSADPAGMTITSWTPIAAGSVAVILEARTSSAELVVLKLVREGVRRRMESDLRVLYALSRMVERLPAGRAFPLSALMTDWSVLILAQCDMLVEAANAAKLAAIPGLEVRIAAPFIDLARTNVLPMQYLPGKYDRVTDAPDDLYRQSCVTILRAVYRMIFIHGCVHCDLHPGNIAIGEDEVPILYDYGLVADLNDRDRQIFLGLFMAIATGNAVNASFEILRSATSLPPDLDRVAFGAEVAVIVDRWSGLHAGNFLIAAFVWDLFDLQHRHKVRSVPGFAKAVWSLATYEGLVRARYPDLDFQGEALSFLLSVQATSRRTRD